MVLAASCAAALVVLLAMAPFASAQQATSGRVLGVARGQMAWLSLDVPRVTPLTALVQPTYPADVSAVPGRAVRRGEYRRAVRRQRHDVRDLVAIDLASGATRPLLQRFSGSQSLDVPVFWPDGHAILFQRSSGCSFMYAPQATECSTRIEEYATDGAGQRVLLNDGRFPAPAPDGTQLAFVRSVGGRAGLFGLSVGDRVESTIVPPDQFVAIAYPRYAPDGQRLAFAAISLVAPPDRAFDGMTMASAGHGFPWEVWLVNADGTDLRRVPNLLDDDPSVTWSSDGSSLLVFGGWGSFLVDPLTGESSEPEFSQWLWLACLAPDEASIEFSLGNLLVVVPALLFWEICLLWCPRSLRPVGRTRGVIASAPAAQRHLDSRRVALNCCFTGRVRVSWLSPD